MVVAAALMAVGLVMVATASVSVDRSLIDTLPLKSPFGRQVIFVLMGLAVMLITTQISTVVLRSEMWRRRLVVIACGLTVICLLGALLPGVGDAHRGSSRWVRIAIGGYGFGFQPSEIAKPVLVIFLAWLLADRAAEPRDLKAGFLPAAITLGVFVALVGKEDFGTAVLLGGVGVAMMFVAGCQLRYLAAMAGVGAIGMAGLLYAAPYRLERLAAYRDVWADPQGGGYQPLQSLATIASGGWFGTGLGAGVQKYGYLPESHTDFIFAVICEETGVFGAILVLGLYAVFVWLGLRIMLAAASRFEGLIAFGLTATVGLQAAMNVAVVTVVTPTTGISLPLISAGGSGIIAFCLLTGLLMAVAIRGTGRRFARTSLDAVSRGVPARV